MPIGVPYVKQWHLSLGSFGESEMRGFSSIDINHPHDADTQRSTRKKLEYGGVAQEPSSYTELLSIA